MVYGLFSISPASNVSPTAPVIVPSTSAIAVYAESFPTSSGFQRNIYGHGELSSSPIYADISDGSPRPVSLTEDSLS